MNPAQSQRLALAELLKRTGEDAPTIIGWTTYELVAHLWVRENDPLSLPGMGLSAFAELTRSRMDRAMNRFNYAQLVRRFREPGPWTRLAAPANQVEFLVHRLDVLRADPALGGLELDPSEQTRLWGMAKLMAFRLRKAGVGVVLERSDTGDVARVAPGNRIVTVVGLPSEMLMLLTGRLEHAELTLTGPESATEQLRAADLSL